MTTNTLRICPNCQQVNSAEDTVCTHCGTALNGENKLETMRVSDMMPPVERPEPASPTDLGVGALALHIMGEKAPILTEGENPIILGRNVFGEDSPTIDLTNYHGRLLGVSRHHAAIHFSNDTYTVEDLNSSNGTWLNDERLEPHESAVLHNGDMMRLGQLVLFVHFQEGSTPLDSMPTGDSITTRKLPFRRGESIGDIRSITVNLVGRPERIEVYPDMVKTTLLHVPEAGSLPPNAPAEFQVAHTYTVYIPINQWRKVETALTNPHDLFVVEGICSYTVSDGISVYATRITSKYLEVEKARRAARRARSHQRSTRRTNS